MMTSDEWRHASPRDVTSRELDKADMPGDLLGGACNGHVPDIDALSIYFRLKLESGGTNAKHLSLINGNPPSISLFRRVDLYQAW